MTAQLNEVVGETGDNFQVELSIFNTADNGAAAGCTKVNSEEIFFVIHIMKYVWFTNLLAKVRNF
jgi:hypothetical protein